jgi:alcohol dehydrogenase
MDISFKFDPEILVGLDTLSMAGTICSRYGQRIMIAADHALDSNTVTRLKTVLEDSGIEAIVFDGIEETSGADMADNLVELTSASHCNSIIGFGGRNSQIIARMAAIMAPTRMSSFELLEGRPYRNKFLPFISIPTEGLDTFALTNYFVAGDPRSRLVKSVQSPTDLYTAIIIDNNLLTCLSGEGAMSFVLGGLFSAAEAYCSSRANFLSDALLERALNFYAKLFKSGAEGIDADTYAQASFLTALGNSASSPGAGAALSSAINARFSVPRQTCSAALFPHIAEKLTSARPEKMAKLAAFLGNTKTASTAEAAGAAAETIKSLMAAQKLPADLKSFGISLDMATAAVEAARNLEFVANSPWTVSEEDVFEIIKKVI